MSFAKEPYFFAAEFPGHRVVRDFRSYDELFAHARDGQLRGEASAIYLSSPTAIPSILRRRPDAKFIALIRDPVEMFISFHNECVKGLDEDQEDPENAWRLQGERAAGRQIPLRCSEPGYLQYRNICSIGSQIRRLFELVPADNRLVISLDSMSRDPSGTNKAISDFLSIAHLSVAEIARENAYARHRVRSLAWLLRGFSTQGTMRTVRYRLKPHLNRFGLRPLSWAYEFSLKKIPKPKLSDQFREELREQFSNDVTLLEQLLGWDLSHWRRDELALGRAAS
jgi:hypothetical protein